MPRGDGTGPMGMGPMTGRGAGFCAGFNAPGYLNPGYGAGFARGRGRGFRRMYYATGLPGWARYGYEDSEPMDISEFDEREVLERQAKALESQLKRIKRRLSTYQNNTEEKEESK